jgi:hypothetical protein
MKRGFVVFALMALLGSPRAGSGHEKGVIHLGSRTPVVGQVLNMRGEKFSPNTVLRLELRGPLAVLPLAQVQTDSAGGFRAASSLPAEATPGIYTIVALAPDGDEAGRTELAIIAAPLGPEAPLHGAEHLGNPTDAAMDLEIRRGVREQATIAAFIGICAIVGVVLFRRGRDRNP